MRIAGGRLKMSTSCSYSPVPIPSGLRPSPLDKGSRPPGPHLRGPQLGDQGSQRKGAGAQLNGSRSMTAAAERAVTFGSCFYRWTARLLSCLGSSAAQGIGGRVIAAPTGGAYLRRAGEDTRPYGGSWKLPLVWAGVRVSRGHPHPAFPSGPVPDRTAGAHCAPLRRKTGGIVG